MKNLMIGITLLLFALPVCAATYTWEDDQGTVNFTGDLGNVPAKYRKKVKIVGEEELLPSDTEAGEENPPAKAPVKGSGEGKQSPAPGKKVNEKVVYDGKDVADWKAEHAALDADVKAAEKQLVEYRDRLKDSSSMSRTEYLSIQATIHSIENSVLMRRQKLEDFNKQAADAGVPSGVLE